MDPNLNEEDLYMEDKDVSFTDSLPWKDITGLEDDEREEVGAMDLASDEEEPVEPADKVSSSGKEGYFTYKLENYSKTTQSKIASPWRDVGGYKWRFLIFPRGNQTKSHLSLYLDCGGPIQSERCSWAAHIFSQSAKFNLVCINQEDNSKNIVKNAEHRFTDNESDWGFKEFIKLDTLMRPENCFLVEDSVIFGAQVILVADAALETNFFSYDSRKETGYVGLKNQGATCYMNSLLQTLFHLGEFRKAVYRMPITVSSDGSHPEGLTYALQRIFYDLQYSPTVVKTKKLTDSFGWDNTDAFTQHDVQELNRILCDALEEKMKKETHQRNTIQMLFEGKLLNYIKCIHVPYESTRIESFYDLSLNVRGCADIYESFEKYTEVEIMEGDNKYRAEGYEELQEAKKGVKFLTLPPVLQLHLKRFEYDFIRDMMVKVNDKFKFYETVDLNRFVDTTAAEEQKVGVESNNYVYVLHSVLVHVGDVHGGHYYAFIRPQPLSDPSTWFKFDDETVLKADKTQAVDDNFGVGGDEDETPDKKVTHEGLGPIPPPKLKQSMVRRFVNAYMLQYVRIDKVDEILSPLTDDDVPVQLREQFEREKEEEARRKKERMEAHLYCTVAVATEANLLAHKDLDLIGLEGMDTFKVRKTSSLKDLKMFLHSKKLVKDISLVRLWKCSKSHRNTLRPQCLLANGKDDHIITDSSEGIHNGVYMRVPYTGRDSMSDSTRLFVFVEDLSLMDGRSVRAKVLNEKNVTGIYSAVLHSDEVFLFFKYYTPFPVPMLSVVGKQLMKLRDTVGDALAVAKEFVGIDEDESVFIFEEKLGRKIPRLNDMSRNLMSCELKHGDIIVIQKVPPAANDERVVSLQRSGGRYLPTFLEYIDYLWHRIEVEVRNAKDPLGPAVAVELSSNDSYEHVRRRISNRIDPTLDPEYVRFYPPQLYTPGPRNYPITPEERHLTLDGILRLDSRTPLPRVLYYERTRYPSSEYDDKEEVLVTYYERNEDDTNFTSKLNMNGEEKHQLEPSMKEEKEEQQDFQSETTHFAHLKHFSILVARDLTFHDLLRLVRKHLQLDESIPLRLLEVKGHLIIRMISPEEMLRFPTYPHDRLEVRVERIPLEELEGDMRDSVLVPVHHICKENRYVRLPELFGIPFVMRVSISGETVSQLLSRIGEYLKARKEEIRTWKLYEIRDGLFSSLDDMDRIWVPESLSDDRGEFSVSLGLEHKDENAKKWQSPFPKPFADKPLKIRG
ncbi:hypothetical protein GpartN1_g3881.t1 [Galdieria partita]|uniref:ubiquitinyl hydrolase 1 n=1 Tax=Galdieria partita TaxID=83374 RepID=A0A9C7PX62_9RHOD|nr:hypothetical protein GpartN1_g3881.t1 [Galdieria partita]